MKDTKGEKGLLSSYSNISSPCLEEITQQLGSNPRHESKKGKKKKRKRPPHTHMNKYIIYIWIHRYTPACRETHP